ncbi:DUF6525 family protein [Ruegeria sp. Alg231-54]|uniref:DUF6525 family protein n=1 Tax=Ruegeria sp. Alg231-54 TaxID=1922221 RepID=UPI001F1C2A5C|nr:DUF6525 family protein [Ruegeria sp. Alg231-54]
MTDRRKNRNPRSRIKRRRRTGSPMQAYDALPAELRLWLASACLPWSPASALRIWHKVGGAHDPDDAYSQLNAFEQSMLQRDGCVWDKALRV